MFKPVLCPVCGKDLATTPERAALLGGFHPECWKQVQQEPQFCQQRVHNVRLRPVWPEEEHSAWFGKALPATAY
jgi:hypothetical protein